jgi:putative ATPase
VRKLPRSNPLRVLSRRLIPISAPARIGTDDPTALQAAVAVAQTVPLIAMPEAQLTLAHASVHRAAATESNAVTTALGDAMSDIKDERRVSSRLICATDTRLGTPVS